MKITAKPEKEPANQEKIMRGSFNLTLELLSEIYLKCGSIPNKA
jgi:hypothetical protein